jgi:uncharacterized protein YraI
MSHKKLAVALSVLVAGSPVVAQPGTVNSKAGAPTAGPGARYCLRVEAPTGSHVERILCWTRQQWADQDVDVDEEWAKEGVTVIE